MIGGLTDAFMQLLWGEHSAWPHPPSPRHLRMHARPRAGNTEQVVGSISLGRALLSIHSHTTSLLRIFPCGTGVGGGCDARDEASVLQSPQSSGEPGQEAAAGPRLKL